MGSFHFVNVFSSVFLKYPTGGTPHTLFHTLFLLLTVYHSILLYRCYDYMIVHCIDIIYLTSLSFLFLILINTRNITLTVITIFIRTVQYC